MSAVMRSILAASVVLVGLGTLLRPRAAIAQSARRTVLMSLKGDTEGKQAELKGVNVTKRGTKWVLYVNSSDPKIGCVLTSADAKTVFEVRRAIFDILVAGDGQVICSRGDRDEEGYSRIDLDATWPVGTWFNVRLG